MENEIFKTKESLEFQWKCIPEYHYLLSDKKFKENISSIISNELNLPKNGLKVKSCLTLGVALVDGVMVF
ncbi:MAG: hypothetical protein QW818_01770 [Candidatus Aenigmatarchaeota archaeon]